MAYIDESMNKVAPILRDKRKALKLSQRDLGQLAGVTQATIANIEQANYNPNYKTIAQIADALGLEVKLEPKRRNEKRYYY